MNDKLTKQLSFCWKWIILSFLALIIFSFIGMLSDFIGGMAITLAITSFISLVISIICLIDLKLS